MTPIPASLIPFSFRGPRARRGGFFGAQIIARAPQVFVRSTYSVVRIGKRAEVSSSLTLTANEAHGTARGQEGTVDAARLRTFSHQCLNM
jgi:hypothetical protein